NFFLLYCLCLNFTEIQMKYYIVLLLLLIATTLISEPIYYTGYYKWDNERDFNRKVFYMIYEAPDRLSVVYNEQTENKKYIIADFKFIWDNGLSDIHKFTYRKTSYDIQFRADSA